MNRLVINKDTQLESRIYSLPEGITIDADNVALDGNGATIIAADQTREGITIVGRKNIVIKNLRLLNYHHGISVRHSSEIEISNCMITSTAEIRSNTLFLDIWKPAADAYGGAIFLEQVTDAAIHDNDLQHQMNGILSYQCKRLNVTNNVANYCSGFGFHLFETCNSTFANNYADYCCRYYLSDSGSHLGADAAGFLIVHGSCNNIFKKTLPGWAVMVFSWRVSLLTESMWAATITCLKKMTPLTVPTTPLRESSAKAMSINGTKRIIRITASGWDFPVIAH